MGIEAVKRAFEIFFSILEVPANHDHEPDYKFFIEEDEVIIWGNTWIHPIGRPLTKPMQITNRLKFFRGRLIEFHDRFDVDYAHQLLNSNGPN